MIDVIINAVYAQDFKHLPPFATKTQSPYSPLGWQFFIGVSVYYGTKPRHIKRYKIQFFNLGDEIAMT